MNSFQLGQTAQEKMILVAHRGVAGGNIPCNTKPTPPMCSIW